MPSHLLTNFEIKKYYRNETKFKGVYLRNNLPKTKNSTYAINRDEYESIGIHWIALYLRGSYDTTYFKSLQN